ncbi:FMN reductase (NADPH) [Corynebacterium ciconiae DSM 44920]|uniref:CE1759 family FMN reductase n=1 Tax=Corynebacterium ciconiae TaxID=227319 RepID=UPI00035E3BF9|nr:CE1759 family FMN reductase [Corynebacterium ciconiae]WKD61326.1 FMN reductase (NADPH) [Corynebacterium ciconiae DSM 44920]
MPSLLVISAGLSSPSSTLGLARRIGAATEHALAQQGHRLELSELEVRTLAFDLASYMTEGFQLSPALHDAHRRVEQADGLIIATPIFTASFSGLLKMFVDSLPRTAVAGTPTTLAATAGSPRHLLAVDYALRPLITHLKASVLPTAVFQSTDSEDSAEFVERIQRAAAELAGALATVPSPAERTADLGSKRCDTQPRTSV